MLFEQTEVVQVVAVPALQAGTQTLIDDGPSTSAGRRRSPWRGVPGRRIVGGTGQDAG